MPSRKSCEKELRDEREQLLDNVLMEKDNKDNTVRSFSAVSITWSLREVPSYSSLYMRVPLVSCIVLITS